VLGEVTGVELGGQDRLVVTTPTGAEVLVPFVADLVGDPEGGRIRIDPPAGLFDPR
jgi:ribosomal 30S subunit maturation factor RimM